MYQKSPLELQMNWSFNLLCFKIIILYGLKQVTSDHSSSFCHFHLKDRKKICTLTLREFLLANKPRNAQICIVIVIVVIVTLYLKWQSYYMEMEMKIIPVFNQSSVIHIQFRFVAVETFWFCCCCCCKDFFLSFKIQTCHSQSPCLTLSPSTAPYQKHNL